MNEISIVTAFFDIGRGDWTPDKGLPHYLQRTTDTYIERFGHMAKLENEMVVFTSSELAPKIKELRGDRPTEIIVFDFHNSLQELRDKIKQVQRSEKYQSLIHPSQIRNPEYWNADYVLINALKSTFVRKSIDYNIIKNDLVAWLDFGYCRTEDSLSGKTRWQYPFDTEKVHFFTIKDFKEGTYIQDIIANNDVHVTGPCIVAGKSSWRKLELLVQHNMEQLLKNNLIDDDQTLLLMSYLSCRELFELHPVSSQDWFVAFKDYNESTS
jgi:protein YibB